MPDPFVDAGELGGLASWNGCFIACVEEIFYLCFTQYISLAGRAMHRELDSSLNA